MYIEILKKSKVSIIHTNMTKKGNKKVTLSIDSAIYDSFRKYCDENAILLSKKIEIWMKKELETQGWEKKKKK